jgi:hypothetical protein
MGATPMLIEGRSATEPASEEELGSGDTRGGQSTIQALITKQDPDSTGVDLRAAALETAAGVRRLHEFCMHLKLGRGPMTEAKAVDATNRMLVGWTRRRAEYRAHKANDTCPDQASSRFSERVSHQLLVTTRPDATHAKVASWFRQPNADTGKGTEQNKTTVIVFEGQDDEEVLFTVAKKLGMRRRYTRRNRAAAKPAHPTLDGRFHVLYAKDVTSQSQTLDAACTVEGWRSSSMKEVFALDGDVLDRLCPGMVGPQTLQDLEGFRRGVIWPDILTQGSG